jgi:hypothetical protein
MSPRAFFSGIVCLSNCIHRSKMKFCITYDAKEVKKFTSCVAFVHSSKDKAMNRIKKERFVRVLSNRGHRWFCWRPLSESRRIFLEFLFLTPPVIISMFIAVPVCCLYVHLFFLFFSLVLLSSCQHYCCINRSKGINYLIK